MIVRERLSQGSEACIISNVERAIQALPSSPQPTDINEDITKFPTPTPPTSAPKTPLIPQSPHVGEEPAIPLKLPSTTTIAEDTKRFLLKTGDQISKPLNAIGKIFNEAMDGLDEIERQREQSRMLQEQQQQQQAQPQPHWQEGTVAPNAQSIFSQMSPDWLFGGSSPRASTPLTPAGGGGAVPGGGAVQTPYRPRVRPGSAGGSFTTPEGTPLSNSANRNSSYQIPPLNLSGSPLPVSRSLPGDMDRPSPQLRALDPRTQQQFAPPSRTGSPLDLTALQNEIDRAHSQANIAAKSTLLQMFPGCEPEVIDMVLEANRGDLGASIESLLDIVAS